MLRYVTQRIALAVLVLVGVSVITFLLLHLTGDPTSLLLPVDTPAAVRAQFRHQMGFDQPLYVQYGTYIWHVLHGNFGKSYRQGQSAITLVLQRLPYTYELTFAALGFALAWAVPAGIIAATRAGSIWDTLVMIVTLVGQGTPTYWLGLLSIGLFAVSLRWLPVSGAGGLRHLVLPAGTLGLYSMARIARVTRSSMLEVIQEDFLRTARAKGVPTRQVWFKHALRNAALPIATVAGLELGVLLGGAIITETIFAWPGVGLLTINAINGHDFPVVQATVFVLSLTFVVLNLLTDLAYAVLDPRIRLDSGSGVVA